MKKKNKAKYFGAVVLSLAMIVASASINADTKENLENEIKIIKGEATPEFDCLQATGQVEYKVMKQMEGTDVKVTTSEDDEIEPAIGIDPDDEYLLAYTTEVDFTVNDIVWTFSTDEGQTWDPGIYYQIDGIESHPAISYMGVDKSFTGTIQGDPIEGNGAYQFRFLCTDPTDTDTYEMTHWDWSASFPYADRLIPDIGGYNLDEKPWWYGVITCVGTRDVRVDMPIFNYANYVDEGSGWSSYWDEYQGCENTAVDVDLTNGNFYSVWDYMDGADWDLIMIPGGCLDTNGDGYLDYYTESIIGGAENTKYPAIGANDDYVMIVAQTDEAGNQDIVCYYSDDAGANFEKSFVANSVADETYPTIVVYGEQATCTFIMDGDLYFSKTNNGGETWSTPEQVNDVAGTVYNEFRNADITTDGTVVWADEQMGNLDIFLDNVGGVATPKIEIQEIKGGLGVSAVIVNTGDAPATNVPWTITITGGLLNRINKVKTDTIGTLNPGDSVTVKSGIFFGFGKIAIEVNAGTATETANGRQWIIFTTIS